MPELKRAQLLALHYALLRIRKVQLKIESRYHLDEMKTPVHLCIGQEAIPIGVSAHLNRDDYISSNHRGHGHYLAKGGDLNGLIAELYCRETGCAKGRGGSMHLADPLVGHLGSSSIVGGGIPIGTGMALAIQMKKEKRVSVVYFSDGAADEGVLYESLNFAMLKRLPVIYVYENNQFSVCSRAAVRHPGPNIFHNASPDLLNAEILDGNSVLAVYAAAAKAVARARAGQGPSFLECLTYRLRGHAGAGSDAKLGYRTEEEIARWEAKCPLATFRTLLLSRSDIALTDLEEQEQTIDREIEAAFAFAQQSPLPPPETVTRYLFKE